eukprot:CAMPEP_0185906102 /NCGR_PEP_ID=MMETSP0196C-20130402/5238_1 /TAXON_ID=2932 /ORGANISM="Alexandrium fundyense, Strain CCMP1719" /LENGTH=71 /DNA_ID=CAMNT_0028625773 /DNA_START=115 /DNA_END=327 /DNA_ORIENTATION=+
MAARLQTVAAAALLCFMCSCCAAFLTPSLGLRGAPMGRALTATSTPPHEPAAVETGAFAASAAGWMAAAAL